MRNVVSVCVAAVGFFLIVTADKENLEYQTEDVGNSAVETNSTWIPWKLQPAEDNYENNTDAINIACGRPPEIEGAITPLLEGTEYPVGTTIGYRCNFGYVGKGSDGFLSTCRIDEDTGEANWSNPDISCVSRSCGDPGYVVNGRRIGNLFTFPNKVEFECDQGHQLHGLRTRYCLANGEWSGRLPTCQLVYCPVPSAPANGRARYASLEYGTELRYECNNGFALKNYEPRVCTGNGTWSNKEPECIEAKCKIPVSPDRGSVQFFGEPKTGSLAIYSCDDGTSIFGTSTSKCLSTGEWTFDPPKCLRTCKVTEISNGEIGRYEAVKISRFQVREQFVKFQVGENVLHNETVVLHCRAGFMPVSNETTSEPDSVIAICNDGSWSKLLQCKEKMCLGDPPSIENGLPVIRSRMHGHVIWYDCNDGFKRLSPGEIRCVYGSWSGYTPKCGPKMCAIEPLQVRNGKTKPFRREHGSVVQYECDENFVMKNNNSIVHCNAGKWEGEPPSCEEFVENTRASSSSDVSADSLNPIAAKYADACYCTYDFPTDLITATVGDRRLEPRDRIRKGGVVTLRCSYVGMDLLWTSSGLRLHPSVNLTCDVCKDWQQHELPICDSQLSGDSLIVYDNNMKILPGGIIEVKKKDSLEFRCINTWGQPAWHVGGIQRIRTNHAFKNAFYIAYLQISSAGYQHAQRYNCYHTDSYRSYRATIVNLRVTEPDIKCDELQTHTKRGVFNIHYENERKVNSAAYYTCKQETQKLIGASSRICSESGRWSGSFTACVDITCWKPSTYNGLIVSYTNSNKVNSIATFRCSNQRILVGKNSSVCQPNETWSNTWPTCEMLDIRCPPIDGNGLFNISYSNDRKINSTAQFFCRAPFQKVEGCNFVTCQQNGEWSGVYPTCVDYITCPKFEEYQGLEVSYSDSVRVGSIATFSCLPPNELVGASSTICRADGSWNQPSPICEIPKCSLDTLGLTLPESVFPDLVEITDEFVPYGTEIRLLCEDNMINMGTSQATCKEQGRWEYGNVQCVPGCFLNKELSPFLLIEPTKDGYRFGEFILLSCPPGHKLNREVERIMCMGRSWSDELPDCLEIRETSPLDTEETTRKPE